MKTLSRKDSGLKLLDRELAKDAKKHRKKKKRLSSAAEIAVYLLSVFLISVILSGFLIIFANDMFALVRPTASATLVLENADTHDITKELRRHRIIRSRFSFELYLAVEGKNRMNNISGEFTVSSEMPYKELEKLFFG